MRDLTADEKAARAEARKVRRHLRQRLRELDAAICMTQSDLPPEERARQIAAQMREREMVRETLLLLDPPQTRRGPAQD